MAVFDLVVILIILTKLLLQHIMDIEIFKLAEKLGELLKYKNLKIAVSESCTGGGICQALTDVPGSSAWFDRGFVTYSNNAKVQMLGVKQVTLEKYGAVSEEVVIEMVDGALINSEADTAVSVTGIAGPGGGTVEKPVGTVYIAGKTRGKKALCLRHEFSGDRIQIRKQTIQCALELSFKSC